MAEVINNRAPAVQTSGHLLNGKVHYAQPAHGFRSGIEPVLLAASIPAQTGERVIEGGSGAGAVLLCLAARVANVYGVGVEGDTRLVSLSRQNAAANGWPCLSFIEADISSLPAIDTCDHACANPPYHDDTGTPSSDAARRAAKLASERLLSVWAAALARTLRRRGTLTFILPAAQLPQAMAAFTASDCRPTAMLPLWPMAGKSAKLMLLRGIKGSRSPFRLLPGLVLHAPNGAFTSEADAILRDGAALPF